MADIETPERAKAGPAIQVAASRFVTVELAAKMTGLTQSAIRTKIGKGIWVEGWQFIRRQGTVFIDMKGYEQWVAAGKA